MLQNLLPAIHAASHIDNEERVARISISIHACDPVPIVLVMVVHLPALWGTRAPLQFNIFPVFMYILICTKIHQPIKKKIPILYEGLN